MFSRELTAASAKPMVLSILAQGESYGYAIIQEVKERSGGEIEWAEGALYPVLYRLERQKLIASVWRKAESGRRRRYYRIEEAGLRALAEERRQWRITNTVLDELWNLEPRLT